ncbi:MAG TPA: CHAT domain-containing protein [Nitrospiraceae bacterium]|nr:CHAT domain-containing protein [Nitrospiraceae bacterium]
MDMQSNQKHAFTLVFFALFVVTTLLVIGTAHPGWAATPPESSPDALMKQGAQFSQRGAFDQAIASWKEAAQFYERDGRIKEQSQALVQLALASQALGQVRQSLQQLELALSLAQQVGDPVWLATVLDSLGRAYLATRQTDAAGSYLDHALDIARTHGGPTLKAAVLNDVGILQASQSKYKEALATYSESASLAHGAGQEALAVRARINAVRVAIQLKEYADAEAWLDQASEPLQGFAPSHDKAEALINLGLAYSMLSPSRPSTSESLLLKAAAQLREAASVTQAIGDTRTVSYAWGHLGHLYETEHRYDEALSLTRRAVFAAQSVNASESLYRWQWQMGRVLTALNKLDDAIAAYRSAIHILQPIRLEVALAAQTPGSTAPESVRPLYFEYADLLLHRAALMDEDEMSQGYLKAARDAIEASKAAELRDYFRDECVDAVQSRLAPLETVSPTTAVVYPIVLADRIELLVNLPDRLKRVSVPVPSTTLTQEVRAFRRLLEKRTTREYLPHAQQLYDWLIRPLEPDLARFKIDTLVFVPDGPLRTIPMAALHDGKQFLISKYAVATTPGLKLTDPRPLRRDRLKVLSAGLTEGVQGYPPLPYVATELQALEDLYGRHPLLNKDFRFPSLEKEMREQPFTIVHIATHGKFESRVEDTFLLTFDAKLTMNQLDQAVGLFRFRDEPLELLTLSACETAVGDDRAALGLAGVAIKAGARSALATLWFINDEASSLLVAEFYEQLQKDPSASKALALQRAQGELIKVPAYRHPSYWAPFLLLNNWL